ncbi:hypothetical protein PFISCL1PPCAC_20714, partial [Pristionchus fissidentatus]
AQTHLQHIRLFRLSRTNHREFPLQASILSRHIELRSSSGKYSRRASANDQIRHDCRCFAVRAIRFHL